MHVYVYKIEFSCTFMIHEFYCVFSCAQNFNQQNQMILTPCVLPLQNIALTIYY